MANKPPLSAVGTVYVELFGPPADTSALAKWDSAIWDASEWVEEVGWQDVTPESLNVQISWGTDDNMGALSVCAAGSWQVATYDPQRILDPSNYNSPFTKVLKPGGLVRIMYRDNQGFSETVRVGFIDEIDFDMMAKTGSIRASDGVSLMVKAKTPAGMRHDPETPVSLRAFARYILEKANVKYIKVEPDPTGAQKVQNPSFEIADSGTTTGLANWTKSGSANAFGSGGVAGMTPITGTKVCALQATVDAQQIYIEQTPRIPVVAGKSYTLSAWVVRRFASAAKMTLRADAYNSAGVSVKTVTVVGNPAMGVWEHLKLRYDCPSDGSVATLRVLLGELTASEVVNGDYWFIEDVHCQEIVGGDPAIGGAINEEASAWAQITTAALDCMHAVWLDREGVLRFRYFGKPKDRNIHIGGANGIPLDNVTPHLSLEGVFNHAIARYISFSDAWSDQRNQQSVDIFGDLLLKRDFPNPNSAEWVDQMLQDRGAAAVQYAIGTLRPRTRDELFSVLSLGMVDMVGLHVDKHGNPVNRDVIVLGGEVEANTESGWSAKLTTYEPASPWWNKDADRIYQTKTIASLTVNTTYDRTAGSSGDGGAEPIQELQSNFDPQFGTPSVQKVRQIQVKFDPIDFFDMAFPIYDAKLRWFLPKHDDATEDESAKRIGHIDQIYVKQIVGAWDASSNGSTIGTVEDGKAWAEYQQGEWIEFSLTQIVMNWQRGTYKQEDGLLLKPFPFESDVEDAVLHGLFAGALSDTPPYILVLYKSV